MKNHLQYQKLKIVSTIIIVGFTVSVFYHYLMGSVMGFGFPFNNFVFTPDDQFKDFLNVYDHLIFGDKQVFPVDHNFINYFLCLPSLFSFHGRYLAYTLYAGVFVVYLFFFNYFQIKKNGYSGSMDWSLIRNSFVFTLMTYPVLLAIDRGNSEMYVFILISLSILFYYDKKFLISAILLGLAIHLKIYFVVFLLIYFVDKKYREMGIVIFLFFILPILAFLIDKWVFPATQFSDSIFIFLKSAVSSGNWYNNTYVLGDGGAAYCSSLYGGLKAIIYYLFPGIQAGNIPVRVLFYLYLPVTLLIAGATTLHLLFFEKEAWKRVALVTFILIICPYVTADYRLVMLFIPLWMFINSNKQTNYNVVYAILFGLLLIPKDYYIIRDWISISVIINPLIIILFIVILFREGIITSSEQIRGRFRRIKKLTFHIFLVASIIFVMLFIGGTWFLFTPKGNEIVKDRLTNYLTKRFNTTVQFDSLRFSTKDVYADLRMTSVANVHFDLKKTNDSLSGNYKFDILDANKISKRFGEKFGFSTSGKISGSGINNIKMDGVTNIFQGSGKYQIDLQNRHISKINFDLNGIQVGGVLAAINKGDGIVGTANLSGDVLIENRRPTFGTVRFSADSIVLEKSSTFLKLFGLSLVNNTSVRAKTETTFNGKEAVSKININSGIAQISMLDNRIDLKSRGLNSDYLIEISNLKDIVISDSSKVGFINNQLPNLKKLKSILSEKCDGEILIEGRLNKNNGNFELNGHTFDFLENKITKENFKSKSSSFRLENNIVHVNDSIYKN